MNAFHVTARATRDGDGFWLVHVPEIDCSVQARANDEVEPMARDLVATMCDIALEEVAVAVELEDGDRRPRVPRRAKGPLGDQEVLVPIPADEVERDYARGLVARPREWTDAERRRLAGDIAAAKADATSLEEATRSAGAVGPRAHSVGATGLQSVLRVWRGS